MEMVTPIAKPTEGGSSNGLRPSGRELRPLVPLCFIVALRFCYTQAKLNPGFPSEVEKRQIGPSRLKLMVAGEQKQYRSFISALRFIISSGYLTTRRPVTFFSPR